MLKMLSFPIEDGDVPCFLYVYQRVNSHFRILNWRCLPYTRSKFQGIPRKCGLVWYSQYLHFRILKWPVRQWLHTAMYCSNQNTQRAAILQHVPSLGGARTSSVPAVLGTSSWIFCSIDLYGVLCSKCAF